MILSFPGFGTGLQENPFNTRRKLVKPFKLKDAPVHAKGKLRSDNSTANSPMKLYEEYSFSQTLTELLRLILRELRRLLGYESRQVIAQ